MDRFPLSTLFGIMEANNSLQAALMAPDGLDRGTYGGYDLLSKRLGSLTEREVRILYEALCNLKGHIRTLEHTEILLPTVRRDA